MFHNNFLLLIALLFLAPFSSSKLDGFQAKLKHIDADVDYTQEELFHRDVRRTKRRLEAIKARLTNNTNSYQSIVNYTTIDFFQYTSELFIGTPPVPITTLVDTGSNLIWTQCAPCTYCLPETNMYDPSASPSYSNILCSDPQCSRDFDNHLQCDTPYCQYNYSYGSGDIFVFGNLSTETFTFDSLDSSDQVSINLTFGCTEINKNDIFDGIVGLSPGNFSLVSQFETPMFSYCLDPNVSESSFLYLGPLATSLNVTGLRSTPFVNIGSDYPLFYFLNLTGISLGSTLLPISPSVFQYGPHSFGTIIDSGSPFSSLTPDAYDVVSNTIIAMVNQTVVYSYSAFSTCFDVSTGPLNLPDVMTFHFEGADMNVPYMILFQDVKMSCFTISSSSPYAPITTLGNFQHKNMFVVYDLAAQKLSFAPQQCSELYG